MVYEGHIALTDLWAYRAESQPLTPDQLGHLYRCNACVALLGTCQMSNSIEEVNRMQRALPKRPGSAS